MIMNKMLHVNEANTTTSFGDDQHLYQQALVMNKKRWKEQEREREERERERDLQFVFEGYSGKQGLYI